MSELDANVMYNGQRSIATVAQSGEMVESNGVLDASCIVQTARGKQKAVKTFIIGISGDAQLIQVVPSLPETGVSGCFYGILRPELDRDGYGIIEFFVWYEGEWFAVGAYSINIDPETLVYTTDKNVANGIAGLNASGQLNSAQIPYATASNVGGIKQSFDATTGTWTVTTDNI